MYACDSVNCNDGTCSIVGGVADCSCDNGYIGDYCDSHVCDGQTCNGNGNCVVDPNDGTSYLCNCNSGFSGADCSVSACDSYACNDGTCSIVGGAAVCTCNTGYHGDQCEYESCDNPNSCVGNPGTNSCTENSTGFTCDCKTSEGYSGTLCENHVCDENAYPSARVSTSCHVFYNSRIIDRHPKKAYYNGEVCNAKGTCDVHEWSSSMFACTCDEGWYGETCETNDPNFMGK